RQIHGDRDLAVVLHGDCVRNGIGGHRRRQGRRHLSRRDACDRGEHHHQGTGWEFHNILRGVRRGARPRERLRASCDARRPTGRRSSLVLIIWRWSGSAVGVALTLTHGFPYTWSVICSILWLMIAFDAAHRAVHYP